MEVEASICLLLQALSRYKGVEVLCNDELFDQLIILAKGRARNSSASIPALDILHERLELYKKDAAMKGTEESKRYTTAIHT